MKEITITTDGSSQGLVLPQGEWVVEVACSNWDGASATLSRYVKDSESYVVKDNAGDVVFTENAGVVIPGNGVYFLTVTGYANPITFKASQI